METNINIAEILKNKPQGTKLYSSACGKCQLEEVDDKGFKISFYSSKFGFMNGGEGYLDKNGKLYDDGECVVFPSKEMRDWSKFDWKKGDVLVLNEGIGKLHVIFEGFNDDTYTTFKGKHYLCNYDDNEDYNEEEYNDYHKELILRTIEFKKDNVNDAKAYINTIEERFGGKLNLETLEIDKHQEFKDGDILSCDEDTYTQHTILILHKDGDITESIVSLVRHSELVEDNEPIDDFFLTRLYPAREDEKKELFDALAKKGKTWDAVKKQIVDLKPKWTPKPFDRVITRTPETPWTANFFSHIDSDGIKNCIDDRYIMCLPYNDETAKLIGTTNNWRG